MDIMICTMKTWNIKAALKLREQYKTIHNITVITEKNDLSLDNAMKLNPDLIMFPHWSYFIPKEIFQGWNCIVFHMTDLPFGRGGSPLQNLIARGIKQTKISAIRVNEIVDGGAVYLKEDLNLNGTADEIYMRASRIIFETMIPKILKQDLIPVEQEGEPVVFPRRTPEQSEIHKKMGLEEIYDYIRMLDGEGYPKAYLMFGNYKLAFSRASLKNGKIIADVEIMEEHHE